MELLFHHLTEMSLMAVDVPGDHLDVLKDQLLQYFLTNIMGTAFVLVLPMKGAVKECTLCTIVIGRTIVKLLTAIRTIHKSGEHTASSGFCFSMPLLTDLLNLLKDLIFYDSFMRVREDCLILNRIIPLLFIPD